MFTKSSDFYDLLYSSKNYQKESEVLIGQIKKRKPAAKTILDIFCGTAEHHKNLKKDRGVYYGRKKKSQVLKQKKR